MTWKMFSTASRSWWIVGKTISHVCLPVERVKLSVVELG
jgi:hypothetical protein